MDTLTNQLVVSLPDTVAIATAPKEVIFFNYAQLPQHSYVALVHEITSSVLCGIGIVGIIIILCFTVTAVSKYTEQRLRLKHEESKHKDDQKMQEYRNRLDSAWRCLKDFYKENKAGVTDSEETMAKASWDFLTAAFKETQLPKSNSDK